MLHSSVFPKDAYFIVFFILKNIISFHQTVQRLTARVCLGCRAKSQIAQLESVIYGPRGLVYFISLGSNPGMGKVVANLLTRSRMSLRVSSPSNKAAKSLSLGPDFSWSLREASRTSCKNSPICSKSSSHILRVVRAGAPMRTPPGVTADRSPGTQFLLRVMQTESQAFSYLDPVIPWGLRSHKTKWFSVPPEAILYPYLD
mmetsp:Transcript_18151/g.37422  ORF Transcript_18151/g.37422 Transcript_18151/m.37422 type:complete len:201 (-) Transcript_18151:879-1481(-)